MKKYGLTIGIVLMIVGCCFFFVIGTLISGAWWLFGVPFFVLGIIALVLSDKLNGGKKRRAIEKEQRNESLKDMKQSLYEQLERDKQIRAEMLKKIHEKKD